MSRNTLATLKRTYPILMVAALTACGGGGGSDYAAQLAGDWHGTTDDVVTAAGYDRMSLAIDDDGDIAQVVVGGDERGGAQRTGEDDRVIRFERDDGTVIYLHDPEVGNLAYIDSTGRVAVLARGTGERPTFSLADVAREYGGTELGFTAGYEVIGALNAFVEVTGDAAPLTYSIDELGPCEYEGTLNLASAEDGAYTGTIQSTSGGECLQSGQAKAYLSPDRDTVLIAACAAFTDSAVPSDCRFTVARGP